MQETKTIPLCEECRKSTSGKCDEHMNEDVEIIEYYVNGEFPRIEGDKRVIINPPNK